MLRPADGERFTAPAKVEIEATASDPDGDTVRAVFWNGSERLGESAAPPYRVTWTGVLSGTYRISVRVSDAAGDYVDDSVGITVVADLTPPAAPEPACLPWVVRRALHGAEVTFIPTQPGRTTLLATRPNE
jgi:hypothetical protein